MSRQVILMRFHKSIVSIVLSLLLIFSAGLCPCFTGLVLAAYEDLTPQDPPSRLRIEPISADEPAIGYNEFDNYYADLMWNSVVYPVDATAGFINMYLQEINKPYKPSSSLYLRERDLPGGTTHYRLRNLNSGTIYYSYLNAYHTHTVDDTTYNSATSVQSNTLKFMTDIDLDAYSYGVNQIKIEWDDVWNSGRRIDYRLYISENKEFSNTQPIYIGQNQIEPLGPITVNQTTGKLEFIYTVNDPGRVYYIKIAPDISEAELKKTEFSKTIAVSSFIIARTSKVATTESGSIWRIDWSPVVTGLSDIDIIVTYQIYRGNNNNNDVPQYMAAVDDTNFYITVPREIDSYYYIIRAIVTKNGVDVYPGIKIESDRIVVRENDVIATPSVPELVDKFERVSGDTIISYEDELRPDSATILWRVPKKGAGEVDTDVVYDIWLVSNPNVLDNPPESMRLVRDLEMTDSNHVMNGLNLVGYKYEVSHLTPNSTYYFKVIAKKTFIDYIDNELQNIVCSSDPAIKVIITPAEGPIDQPRVPGRPPFCIKKDSENKNMVESTTAVLQIKNKWYEKFNEETGKWEYIRTEKTSEDDIPPYIPDESTLDGKNYRVIEYDSGVTIDVGCVEYVDGMSYNDIANIPANRITGFPIRANDASENAELNPDGLKHNVDITLTNLIPNTTYIIWVRAARRSVDSLSGPSDPIVITTFPDPDVPVAIPTVPEINYTLPGDVYADLAWNFNQDYKYNIKYGTVENLDSASGSVTVEPEDFANSSFYRVKDLEQQTLYFFWIQAEIAGGGNKSEWSDSYTLKTLPYLPPETPTGFGLKNTVDSVTKNSLTFEWAKADGMEYILHIADNAEYKNFTEYKCGSVSEYTVEGLRSNFRYYARLFAHDPEKDMDSKPTQSLLVRTERSDDDYDSDKDIENVISGDFITKGSGLVNNTWNVSITGVNADRFVEHVQTDNVLDYKIDLSSPPSKTNRLEIGISNKVFKALGSLKENIIIVADSNTDGKIQLVLRPEIVDSNAIEKYTDRLGDYNYKVSIQFTGKNTASNSQNMVFKTKDVSIDINAGNSSETIAVTGLYRPMKVIFPYTDSSWYKEGTTSGYVFDKGSSAWKKLQTTAEYDWDNSSGIAVLQASTPGNIAIAEPGSNFYDDIGGHWAQSSINKVASVHSLKSIPGRIFSPDKNITLGEAVKLMLDTADYTYGNDYMTSASKAQFVSLAEAGNPDKTCTREKAIAMVVRLYEIKTGKYASVASVSNTGYSDLGMISPSLLPKVNFAIKNGIVSSRNLNLLNPGGYISRAETVAMLEKLLYLTGELL